MAGQQNSGCSWWSSLTTFKLPITDPLIIAGGVFFCVVAFLLHKINDVGLVSLAIIICICFVVYDIICDRNQKTTDEKTLKELKEHEKQLTEQCKTLRAQKEKLKKSLTREKEQNQERLKLQGEILTRSLNQKQEILSGKNKVINEMRTKIDNLVESLKRERVVYINWKNKNTESIKNERSVYMNWRQVKNKMCESLKENVKKLEHDIEVEKATNAECLTKRIELVKHIENLAFRCNELEKEKDELKKQLKDDFADNASNKEIEHGQSKGENELIDDFADNDYDVVDYFD